LLKTGGLKRQYFDTDGRESLNSHAPKLSGSENKRRAIYSPKDWKSGKRQHLMGDTSKIVCEIFSLYFVPKPLTKLKTLYSYESTRAMPAR